jgi:ABC-type branched-subunit amino acid transport system permease subunit
MDYVLYVASIVALSAAAAYALNLVLGEAGILPVCAGAFLGTGAYTAALWSGHYGSSLIIEFVVAGAIACVVSLAVSLPSLRLHDDYFVLATFILQVLFSRIVTNVNSVTNGALGVPGIPDATVAGHVAHSSMARFVLCTAICVVSYLITRRLATAPYGRVLRAIRSDELIAIAWGKDAVRFKVTAFAICAVLLAAVGVVYAHFWRFVDPSSCGVTTSVFIVTIVIVGGSGGRIGPLIGAAIMLSIPEALRFLSVPTDSAPFLREIVSSGIMLWVLVARPRGVAGIHVFGH